MTSSARTEQRTSVSDPGRVTREEPLDRTSGADDAIAAVLTEEAEADDEEEEGVMPYGRKSRTDRPSERMSLTQPSMM
jgi:hypothetical protein